MLTGMNETSLKNLTLRLRMAFGNVAQASDDLDRARAQAGLKPFLREEYRVALVDMSTYVAERERRAGLRGDADDDATEDVVNLMLDASRFRRGEVVDVAQARRERLSAGKDKRP
jgi:hypothetical protein